MRSCAMDEEPVRSVVRSPHISKCEPLHNDPRLVTMISTCLKAGLKLLRAKLLLYIAFLSQVRPLIDSHTGFGLVLRFLLHRHDYMGHASRGISAPIDTGANFPISISTGRSLDDVRS